MTLTVTTHDSRVLDLSGVFQSVEIETQRFDAPGKITIVTQEDTGIAVPEGSVVDFRDGETTFRGFVFTASRNRTGDVTYTAYDQLRYLKASASYSWEAVTLEQIITQIAADFGLVVGDLATTGYTFPSLIKENETCLDIIFDALSHVIYETGKIFVFYDDAGKLVLREARDLMRTGVIGDGSMMTDYDYQRDIDSNTYNRVKLVRPNKETGRTDVYLVEDTDTQKRWGLLQFYDKVDKNLNEAQITQLAEKYLSYYNRVQQTLSLSALGVPGIRAGSIIPVLIRAVEELSFNRLLLVERCTQRYEGSGYHTMDLEVKSFDQLGGGDTV